MTITIEIPPADELRVATALGSGEPRTPATAEEISVVILGWLNGTTLTYERQKAASEIQPPPLTLSAGL